MKKSASWVIGKVISGICLVLMAVLVFSLALTQLFPVKYLLIGAAVLAVLVLIILVLTWTGKHAVAYVIGVLLAILFCFIAVLGSRYALMTASSVKQITTGNTETAEVGIYMLKGSESAFTDSRESLSYGIMADQDRVNTDLAVSQFEESYGFTMNTVEYDGLAELADGLLDGKSDAIVLNEAYLELLADMEGYETFADSITRVDTTSVVRQIINNSFADDGSDAAEENTGVYDGSSAFTVFISGVDTRGELTAKTRSDVNILATVNPETHQILLVTTPRDYFVPLSISNGQKDKLTHAGIYGVQCCMDTMGMLYGINVNYYVRMNFVGFKDIINALGGVTVHSDYTFDTGEYHFVEGDNEMDGEQALAFARERYSFTEGDRQRGKDQMEVIKAVIRKASSPAILSSYTEVLEAAGTSFETNVSYDMISELVRQQLADGGSWDVITYSVNGSDSKAVPYSMSTTAYVMIPDESTVDKATEMMNAVIRGETITQP